MRYLGALAVCALVWLSGQPAAAGDFDGSNPLLCAAIQAFQCSAGSNCQQGLAESIDAPQFFRINFADKMISGTRESGEVRTSAIKTMTQNETELILQGVQGALGWSMAIAAANGKMVLTASGDRVAFTIFGACTTI